MPWKVPIPAPQFTMLIVLVKVGIPVLFHTRPRLVTAEPPAVNTSPLPLALFSRLSVTGSVFTLGGSCERRPNAPVAWKSLWLPLVLLVARTQYQ